MFLLKINNNLLLCFSIIVHDESQHWHLRFVQLNFDVLKKLYNWNMVKGLSSINHPNQVCGDCILGKNLKAPFLSENLARATEPLELVYKDLCEMRHSSNRYFLTFIDDYNRKFWVYFLKEKSYAFNIFCQFKSFTEKQNGYYLKVLRSDGGGKYFSSQFNQFGSNMSSIIKARLALASAEQYYWK